MFCIHPTYPLGYSSTRLETQDIDPIDIERFAADRPSGTVVDVRERHEYAAGHVDGALLIPMGQLATMNELDRAACLRHLRHGNRSLAMTDLLRVAGFNAWSVTGGTTPGHTGRPSKEDSNEHQRLHDRPDRDTHPG